MSEKLADIDVVSKYYSLFHSAKGREITFDLTFKTLKRLLSQKKCFYTGRKFTDSGKFQRTIDRVDASKGYIEGNVVACCQDMNNKKKDLTIEEINLLYRKINRKLKRKHEKPKTHHRIFKTIRLESSLLSEGLD